MESGGKAVTKIYRKKITVVLSLVLPVILDSRKRDEDTTSRIAANP